MNQMTFALCACVVLASAVSAPAQVRRIPGSGAFGIAAMPPTTAPAPSPHVLMRRGVTIAAFSPDGRVLMTVADDDRQVHFWDAGTGEEANRFGVGVTQAAFCADGGRVLTRSDDGVVRIFDARTGKALRRLAGNDPATHLATISPDGLRVLTAAGAVVTLGDAVSGQTIGTLDGHRSAVTALAFSPDGRRAISLCGQAAAAKAPVGAPAVAAADVSLRHWDLETRKPLRTIDLAAPAQAAYYSNDGKLALVAAGSATTIYDLATGQPILAPRSADEQFPPGQLTADRKTGLRKGLGLAVVMDVTTGQDVRPLDGPIAGLPISSAFSADGTRVIFGTGVITLFTRKPDAPGTVYLHDVATGKLLAHFDGHAREVTQVALAPGGAHAFSRDGGRVLFLWTLPK